MLLTVLCTLGFNLVVWI